MGILCWLWPLLSGIICGILGYYWGRNIWKSRYEELKENLDACKKSRLQLETEFTSFKTKYSDLETQLISIRKSNTTELDSWKTKALRLESELEASNKADVNIDSYTSKISTLETNLKTCNDKNIALEAELKNSKQSLLDEDSWKTKVAALQTDLVNTNNKFTTDINTKNAHIEELETKLKLVEGSNIVLVPFDSDSAKAAFGKKIKQDDLKIVEGIGPKIEELFHKHGIKTWKALSETSQEKCQEVLNSGGERYRIHKPGTWPKQAELAYNGKWKELVKWQDELDGGVA